MKKILFLAMSVSCLFSQVDTTYTTCFNKLKYFDLESTHILIDCSFVEKIFLSKKTKVVPNIIEVRKYEVGNCLISDEDCTDIKILNGCKKISADHIKRGVVTLVEKKSIELYFIYTFKLTVLEYCGLNKKVNETYILRNIVYDRTTHQLKRIE